jgi:uncharacterized protein
VLLEDIANGLSFNMRVNIDDWIPFMAQRKIDLAMIAILAHCTTMISEDDRTTAMNRQGEQLLAQSWKVAPDVAEMLHATLS